MTIVFAQEFQYRKILFLLSLIIQFIKKKKGKKKKKKDED